MRPLGHIWEIRSRCMFTREPKLSTSRSSDSSTRVAPCVLEAMETPAPKSTGGASQKKEADKEKDKRLARCGKCINCKSTVRAHLWLPHSPEPAISACGAARARSVASAAIHAASERSSIGLRAHILLLAWLGWLLSGKPNDGTRSRLPKRHALLSAQDCGNCYNCQDKPKFGGPGARSTLAQPPPLCRALRPAACHQMGGSPCVPASSRGTPCPRHCRG